MRARPGAALATRGPPCGADPTGAEMATYDRHDATYRAARKAGYRSRAAIKLEQIDARFRLFRRGARVLDLGCWPGGWLQVAAARVGPGGRVVGVDLEAIEPLAEPAVHTIVGDAGDRDVRSSVAEELGGRAHLLLSDMAPKLTGIKVADRAREMALVELAVDVALELLAPRGRMVVKLFSGVEGEATALLKRHFASVAKHRPEASRRGSSELYAVVGDRRRGAGGASPDAHSTEPAGED